MQRFTAYLMGACKNVSKEYQNEWRDKIKEALKDYDCDFIVKPISPNDYFNYYEERHKTQRQVKDYYMWRIDKADICICNLNFTEDSVGTGIESEHAVMRGVPVIGYGHEKVYSWTEQNCTVVFDNIDEVIEYVKEYYLD